MGLPGVAVTSGQRADACGHPQDAGRGCWVLTWPGGERRLLGACLCGARLPGDTADGQRRGLLAYVAIEDVVLVCVGLCLAELLSSLVSSGVVCALSSKPSRLTGQPSLPQ